MAKVIKIAVFALLFGIAAFYYWKTYNQLKDYNDKYQTIKGIDEKVIDKLIKARDLQIHYLAVTGEYAKEWDSLFNFVREGKIYVTQETETIIKRPYGGDSIIVDIDTIGVVNAYDSLKNRLGLERIDQVETLKYAPGHPKDSLVEFFINAGKVSGAQVFEVSDPKPLNPDRRKKKERGGLPPLKVGSMRGASLKGNWEY